MAFQGVSTNAENESKGNYEKLTPRGLDQKKWCFPLDFKAFLCFIIKCLQEKHHG